MNLKSTEKIYSERHQLRREPKSIFQGVANNGLGYDVEVIYGFPEYETKLIWCQQGNDVVSAAAIRSAMVDFLRLVVPDQQCI